MPLSEYVISLDGVANSRYFDKLKLLGFTCYRRPICVGWLPERHVTVATGRVRSNNFYYFIERPGVYTQQELLQWKQLEAYNYWKKGCNFIHMISIPRLLVLCMWTKEQHIGTRLSGMAGILHIWQTNLHNIIDTHSNWTLRNGQGAQGDPE